MRATSRRTPAEMITAGRAVLGIELGSTRIKACLVDGDAPAEVVSRAVFEWESTVTDGFWSFSLDKMWEGMRTVVADVVADVVDRHGVRLTRLAAMGVSGMMHGYLPLDRAGEPLVPFRSWRNTHARPAATELEAVLGTRIPVRWSVAQFHQAILDDEPHVADVARLTTLAGYVHARISGRSVLGLSDASGMFPLSAGGSGFDESLLQKFDVLAAGACPTPLGTMLPGVVAAGGDAGRLSAEGALLLDPSGALQPGAVLCAPEGDAGTGMVATNAVRRGTGNLSVGTSSFAMIVLKEKLRVTGREFDQVATPAGDPVVMIHSNNGTSEIDAWVDVLADFAAASGTPLGRGEIYQTALTAAVDADAFADAGGVVAYNLVAGEPVLALDAARPVVTRARDARLGLGSLFRAQVFGVFAALSEGFSELTAREGIRVRMLVAHGGLFTTPGVGQRLAAAALRTPVSVGSTAGEGGAWGIAVLACYRDELLRGGGGERQGASALSDYLDQVAASAAVASVIEPELADVAGFEQYMVRYRAGLPAVTAAARIP